jgi:predicted HTH transcriptional regulator
MPPEDSSTHSTSSVQASSPQVTNDEVEKLLHVSDATATRYLAVLVKEGKIRKIGTAGSGVAYQKI